MKTSAYLDEVTKAVVFEGRDVADKMNKMSLASGQISIHQYLKAAHIIIEDYMAENK